MLELVDYVASDHAADEHFVHLLATEQAKEQHQEQVLEAGCSSNPTALRRVDSSVKNNRATNGMHRRVAVRCAR